MKNYIVVETSGHQAMYAGLTSKNKIVRITIRKNARLFDCLADAEKAKLKLKDNAQNNGSSELHIIECDLDTPYVIELKGFNGKYAGFDKNGKFNPVNSMDDAFKFLGEADAEFFIATRKDLNKKKASAIPLTESMQHGIDAKEEATAIFKIVESAEKKNIDFNPMLPSWMPKMAANWGFTIPKHEFYIPKYITNGENSDGYSITKKNSKVCVAANYIPEPPIFEKLKQVGRLLDDIADELAKNNYGISSMTGGENDYIHIIEFAELNDSFDYRGIVEQIQAVRRVRRGCKDVAALESKIRGILSAYDTYAKAKERHAAKKLYSPRLLTAEVFQKYG